MIRIIRYQEDDNALRTWVLLATLNSNREAVTWDTGIETDDIQQYVIDNAAALEQQILRNGKVNNRLTARLRAHEAKKLLKQSRLEGKTLAQVQAYVETNATNFATLKAIVKEDVSQTWMLYQVVQYIVDALD